MYYLYRFYDPQNGRWLSRDPLQEEGGVNLYGMVFNDPVNLWDPWGLRPIREYFQENATNAALEGNTAGMWMWATAYGVWDGLSFGTLGRTNANQQLLERGCIDEADYHRRQMLNTFQGFFELWSTVTGARTVVSLGGSAIRFAGNSASARYLPHALERGTALVPTLGATAKAARALTSTADDGAKVAAKGASGVDDLIRAGSALDRGGLTKAGRALEKHGSRPGSVFPQATGNVGAKSTQGQAILDDILRSNQQSIKPNSYGGRDVFDLNTLRGVRYDGNGNMVGFLEP